MKIGIVAHDDRRDEAWRLFKRTRADFISVDEGERGPRANHLYVWGRLVEMSEEGEWCVVLEDDAELCVNFMTQLANVIAWCPAQVDLISLYMGRMHPRQWQDRMNQAVTLADSKDICWITSSMCIHGVGIAMQRKEADQFCFHAQTIQGPPRPVDETMSAWCRLTGRTVGYTFPSIVNHADTRTLIKHPDGIERQKGRVAWRFGGRNKWSRVSIPLDPNHP